MSHAAPRPTFPHRHLLGIEGLSRPDIEALLDLAEEAVDVDLHLLHDGRCVTRDDDYLSVELEPGTWDFVVDSFVTPGGDARSGEFLFVVARTDRPS